MRQRSLSAVCLGLGLIAALPLAGLAGDQPLSPSEVAQVAQKIGATLKALPDSDFPPGAKDSYIDHRMRAVQLYYGKKNRNGEYPDAPSDSQIAALAEFYKDRLPLLSLQQEKAQNARQNPPVPDSPELTRELAEWNQRYNKNESALGYDLDLAFSNRCDKLPFQPAQSADAPSTVQSQPAAVDAASIVGKNTYAFSSAIGENVGRVLGDSHETAPDPNAGQVDSAQHLSLDEQTGVVLPPSFPPYFHAATNLQQGRFADAAAGFQKSLAVNPKNAEAASGLTSAYYEQKNYEDAVAAANRTLELNPKDQNALAVLQFSKGRVGGASASAAGSSAAPSLSGTPASVARSGAPVAPNPATPASPLSSAQARAAVEAAMSVKDYAAALTAVDRGLARNPNDPALYAEKSQIELAQRDYVRAAADARAGLALSPRDPDLLRVLGLAQLRGGDYKGAVATANDMIELNPGDAGAYALRAHAYGNLGDRDMMMSDLDRAAQLDPRFREADARMAARLQLPASDDVLFLFPGEEGSAPKAAAPGSRANRFWLIVGASAAGGLLVALALLGPVLASSARRAKSIFTQLTRSGPRTSDEFDPSTGLPAAPAEPIPGLLRDRYELGRKIGAGGMGEVFEGFDRALKRRVAVKKMRPELRSDAREKARFVAEAKTVAALHHENIVDIYAISEDGEDVFLVFEYVDGKTVHELVQSNGKLEPKLAVKIARASADALAFAHARGVIHRDMKPSNVMVDGAGRVKVMDFGIARTAKDAAHRFSITAVVVGTPPYMAPEQEQGQVRRESDVYSLAVCAYEMLTGRLPFNGAGGAMLLNKINMNFIPPSRSAAALPASLDPVFARAFRAVPEERYATPAEFAAALEAALSAPVRA